MSSRGYKQSHVRLPSPIHDQSLIHRGLQHFSIIMADFKVIIVGGGLAGALLANGLRNNGVQFMVYERDKADSNREGYQIRLGPGSQAGFRACLTNDHIDRIAAKLGKSSGAQATAPSLYNTRFQVIIDLAQLPTYTKSAGINRVVLRDILLEPIKKSGTIQYGKGFDRYEIFTEKTGKERVKVYFSDGTHDVGDLLVGADGANSKVGATRRKRRSEINGCLGESTAWLEQHQTSRQPLGFLVER